VGLEKVNDETTITTTSIINNTEAIDVSHLIRRKTTVFNSNSDNNILRESIAISTEAVLPYQ
jgi:hypothetical protein